MSLAIQCSTPSCIKGTIAISISAWPAKGKVLNAFRHQRNNRLVQKITYEDLVGAQRLPASKEQSQAPVHSKAPSSVCAQRLPASKEQSLPLAGGRMAILA